MEHGLEVQRLREELTLWKACEIYMRELLGLEPPEDLVSEAVAIPEKRRGGGANQRTEQPTKSTDLRSKLREVYDRHKKEQQTEQQPEKEQKKGKEER